MLDITESFLVTITLLYACMHVIVQHGRGCIHEQVLVFIEYKVLFLLPTCMHACIMTQHAPLCRETGCLVLVFSHIARMTHIIEGLLVIDAISSVCLHANVQHDPTAYLSRY